MSLFGGKSAATFFSRLFDKEKEKPPDDPEVTYQRKRSQSMFAPNVSSLMSGDHVGGITERGLTATAMIYYYF